LKASLSGEGAVGFLRRQSSQFAPLCILRLSCRDLYNLIDPESSDSYGTAGSGEGWILAEFREAVDISEIEIQSGPFYFPRCFDVIVTSSDGKIVRKEIRDANLNGEDKRARFEIGEKSVRSLKIEQKGPSWEGRPCLFFKSLELFSKTGKFESGVFKTLFSEHRNEIRQFVCLTARDYDLSDVHSLSPRTKVCTGVGDRQWLEIDFVDRQLFLNSYRLKRHTNWLLRSWSLFGTNDGRQGLEEWTKLDSRNESREGEFEIFQVYECFGGPFRYFRLVQEGPDWDGDEALTFLHLDLFGVLSPLRPGPA
jgi:hypothetical protein